MSFWRKLRISVAAAVVISIIFSIVSFAKTSDEIRGEVLRIHVIANSDSDFDQQLKLKVRDAVLTEGADIFDGSVNVENAVEKITPNIDRLECVANRVVAENGGDYTAKISLEKTYFNTRTYDDVTLPAGRYLAVRVVLGEGVGKNWWCVMFPPMCIPAAADREELSDVIGEDGERLVTKDPRYEPRFKIIEVYEKIKDTLTG